MYDSGKKQCMKVGAAPGSGSRSGANGIHTVRTYVRTQEGECCKGRTAGMTPPLRSRLNVIKKEKEMAKWCGIHDCKSCI